MTYTVKDSVTNLLIDKVEMLDSMSEVKDQLLKLNQRKDFVLQGKPVIESV